MGGIPSTGRNLCTNSIEREYFNCHDALREKAEEDDRLVLNAQCSLCISQVTTCCARGFHTASPEKYRMLLVHACEVMRNQLREWESQ